jgi:hypothetical protein
MNFSAEKNVEVSSSAVDGGILRSSGDLSLVGPVLQESDTGHAIAFSPGIDLCFSFYVLGLSFKVFR